MKKDPTNGSTISSNLTFFVQELFALRNNTPIGKIESITKQSNFLVFFFSFSYKLNKMWLFLNTAL